MTTIRIIAFGALMVFVIWVVMSTLNQIIDPSWSKGVGVLLGFAALFAIVHMLDRADEESTRRKR